MSLSKLFDTFEDVVTVNNCSIRWSRKGTGFGGFYFYHDEDGKLRCSSETMGPKFIKEILMSMVDQAIFEDCFSGKFTGAELTPEKWKELDLADRVEYASREPVALVDVKNTPLEPCTFCGAGINQQCTKLDPANAGMSLDLGDLVHVRRLKSA